MTKTYNINNEKYRIILTEHFLQRLTERNIAPDQIVPAIIEMINSNNYSTQYKKHILRSIKNNFSLVLETKKNNNIKLLTAIDQANYNDYSQGVKTVTL